MSRLFLVTQEQEAWMATGCDVDACRTEEEGEPAPAEPCLSSFVEMSEICPASVTLSSHGAELGNRGKPDAEADPRPQLAATAPTPPVPVPVPVLTTEKKGGYDVAYPDRGTVISRYKEKRKNRR